LEISSNINHEKVPNKEFMWGTNYYVSSEEIFMTVHSFSMDADEAKPIKWTTGTTASGFFVSRLVTVRSDDDGGIFISSPE
jgi:hypothetical protein